MHMACSPWRAAHGARPARCSCVGAVGVRGENFFEHLTIPYQGYLPDVPPARGYGTWDNTLIADYYDTSGDNNFVKGFQYHVAPGLTPVPRLARLLPGYGLSHKKAVRRYAYGGIVLAGVGEMLPNRKSRIKLHADKKDAFGIPLASIEFELGDNDRRLI